MAHWLSEPIEALLDANAEVRGIPSCDVLVVGSGYGGAVAAMQLAGPGRSVFVFERGKEYALGDFPESLGELPGHVRLLRPADTQPLGYADALFDLRIGEGISALVGSGLGGGSLINANVAIAPDDELLGDAAWPAALRADAGTLREAMGRIVGLLGVTHDPEAPGKYRALERLSGALGGRCGPAPIAVSFEGGRNAAGVEQSPCVRCGNCVTGCNVGAKGTLAMNLLPLARARGARFFTGASVVSLAPAGRADGGGGWTVRYRRTATEKGPLRGEIHELRARDVVLAAGTLGSTEILLRSQARGALSCSTRLGEGFSGNGDLLAFGYGQERRVGAVAETGSLDPRPKSVGPTINGVTRVSVRRSPDAPARKLLLEDGAVPEPLARVFAELVVGGSLIQRYVSDEPPAWLREHPARDPLGVHREALRHSQLLLGMGTDGAEGKLRLATAGAGADDARLRMTWPARGEASEAAAFLDAVDATLRRAAPAGFDGGQYQQNPLWRAVPEEFARELSGKVPGGALFTVHPLGGCGMGEDAGRGVVDHLGRVFRRDGGVYEGLHVMDGAVIPLPLGVNPFLTIAALAWRASAAMRAARGWVESSVRQVGASLEEVPRSRSLVPTESEPVRAVLTERLVGNLGSERPPWMPQRRGTEPGVRDWLAAEISIRIYDLDRWLADPGRAWPATCTLYANTADGEAFDPAHLERVATGEGSVRLLARDGPAGDDETQRRALAAMLAYAQREGLKLDSQSALGGRFDDLWRIARNHAQWRALEYTFLVRPAGDARAWSLSGRKVLAYGPGKPNLWTALTELPLELFPADSGGARRESYRGVLRVDLVDLARRALLQTRGARTPEALMAMIGAGMLFLRAMMQTHFWGFPAPEYAESAPQQVALPGAIRTRRSGRVAPVCIPFKVPLSRSEPRQIDLLLTRYPHPDGARREPVLLIHGLAHGGAVFATDTIRCPLAASLHDEGYEPWLLEHRLSPALEASAEQSTMDEIAEFDIATAVRLAYDAAGGPVRVFAHCIGAGCFSMAVLRGFCRDEKAQRSMIRAAAVHAVPPWVVASRTNRLRANLAAFVKDAIGDALVNPVPRARGDVDWLETLIDRLAGSLPWPDADLQAHNADRGHGGLGQAICNRMTLFYGVEWVHANLDPRTHRRLAELVGVGNIETFRQVFFIAQRERLTDREGRNAYLSESQVDRHWTFPTLFAHGTENGVFNPLSSRRSAARLRELQERWFNRLDRFPVYLQVVEGYGHMDFLFGSHAARDVYPAICDFFDDERRRRLPSAIPADPDSELWPSPRCGPVIGHARAAGDGRVALRIWFELREDVTRPAAQIAFTALGPGGAVGGVTELPLDVPSCSLDSPPKEYSDYGCYWVYDVLVPGEAQLLRAEVRYTDPPRKPPPGAQRATDGREEQERDIAGDDPSRPAILDLRAPWFARLAGRAPRAGCAFLAGSCRHPGSPFEREASDEVYGGMLEEIGRGADHVLLVGDQIYADATADAFDTREPGERFSGRYRDAFRSPRMRRLLRSAPVYMAIDDHEIQDDWEGTGTPDAFGILRLPPPTPDQLTQAALEAAHHYQRSMGPASQAGARTFWYRFESGGLPFFVMDTRSERVPRRAATRPQEATMFGPAQREALEAWLAEHKGDPRPKFIVCGTPLGPVRRGHAAHAALWRNSDTWYGYPASLRWLIETVAALRPQNLVFVSGDYHFSAVAELAFYCDGAPCVEARQIVASGLFAPMPFANERLEDYDWDAWSVVPAAGSGARLGVKASPLAHGRSHFVRVAATPRAGAWRVTADAVGVDGARFARRAVL